MSEPTVTRTISDDDVARLPLVAGRQDLLEDILRTSPAGVALPGAGRGPAGRRVATGLAVAAAVAAVAAIAVGPPWLRNDPEVGVASAPAPVERALLDAPGWRLESISKAGPAAGGSATYRGDGPTLEINWYPAAQWASRSDLSDLGAPTRAPVLGRMAKVFAYGATDHVAIRPPEGSTFVEVRGQGLDAAAFVALLGRLVPAPGALPAATGESAADRDALIGHWQEGLDLPSGVDYLDPHLPGLTTEQSTAATVLRGLGCGWVRDYGTAVTAGDDQARDVVLAGMQALSTSPAAAASQGTPAPAEVDELLAGIRSGAAPAQLTARCQEIQGD